jgi:hypothetical protein
MLYHNNPTSLQETLKILFSKLKPGGVFLATMARKNDISYVNSFPITTNQNERVVREEAVAHQNNAILVFLDDENQIRKVFAPLTGLDIGYFESSFLCTTS